MQKGDEFLIEYYRESSEEMRFRASTEYRLLQFLLVLYPAIAAGMFASYSNGITQPAYLLLSIAASIFVLLASTFVSVKVYHEHNVRADIGRAVQKIWLYFQMFEQGAYIESDVILPRTLLDEQTGYGTGPGHKRTLVIIWTITIGMVLVLLIGVNPCDWTNKCRS